MTLYNAQMVAQLQQNNDWDYDQALDFATQNGLSVRSVISKIRHLDLPYRGKPKTVSVNGPRIKKSVIVAQIAQAVGTDFDQIAGLDKADARTLNNLLKAVS